MELPDRFPTIETPRLRLRAMTSADDDLVFALFSDPEVTRFYDVETMTERAQAVALAERLRRRFPERTGIRWAIERKDDGRAIGTCGYQAIVASARRASLGFELLRTEWGHGFATEAVATLTAFGHRALRLRRIDGLVFVGNEASAVVLRKCGFIGEAVLTDYGRVGGEFRDMALFAHLDRSIS